MKNQKASKTGKLKKVKIPIVGILDTKTGMVKITNKKKYDEATKVKVVKKAKKS
jgi:hypothetical protein